MSAPPPAAPSPPATPPVPARRIRVLRIVVRSVTAVLVAALVALVLLFAAVTTDTGLPFVMREIARLTDGRLTVSGATGSLLSTFRAQEIRWNGPTTRVVARDVLVTWSPWALSNRKLAVSTLGAGTITVDVASNDTPATLPQSLGLPLAVAIDHASVTTLDWTVGARRGRVTGLAFGYTADEKMHALTSLLLGFEQGQVAGNVTLGAARPFPAGGRIAFTGSERLAGVTLDTRLGGTLAALTVDADGRADDATLKGHVELTPFAPAPLARLDVDARNVDTARFVAALPATRIDATLHATPARDGFAGTFTLVNAAPGRLDATRLPVERIGATFAQTAARLQLTDLDVALAGGGRARGRGDIALSGAATSTWSLELAGVNLAALHAALVPTQLAGRVDATLDGAVQRVEGNIADRGRGLALDFAARVADREVVLTRGRLATAYGSVDASGRLGLAEPRAFTLDATARHFDPATLAAVAHGALDASATARGVLAPTWRANIEGRVAPTSTWGGLPLAATLHATLARGSATDVAVDAKLGSTHATLAGAAGRAGDNLAWTLSAPALAELAKLGIKRLPPTLAGALDAKGAVSYAGGAPLDAGVVVDATARKLALDDIGIQALTLKASVAPAATAGARTLRNRALAATFDADGITGPLAVDHASARLDGSVDAHVLAVSLAARDDHVEATLKGGFVDGDAPHWRGWLTAFDTRGAVRLALAAPAALELAPAQLSLAGLALAFDGGRIDVARFALDHGRIDTAGHFAALPLAGLARVAGYTLPLRSTLTLRGEWNVSAAPRLDGTFRVERDQGDLYGADPDNPAAAEYGAGLRELYVAGTLEHDALRVDARIASQRTGNATLAATVGAGPEAGKLSLDAPLAAKFAADLSSLGLLQPWLGTTAAIGGRAVADVTVHGTLRKPVWAGTIAGDDIRVDSPQWGLQVSEGRVRARLAGDALVLDEFSVRGGDGRLTAHGTLARGGRAAGDDTANITWQAKNFRLMNRPDRHFIVDGDGVAALRDDRLRLTGRVDVVEGRVVYEPLPPLLGDDVVVKGRPRAAPRDDQMRSTTTELDFDVNLGNRVTFSGMGLDARLAGRVHISTGPDGLLYGRGTISTQSGTYYAFGQRLVIDRGQLFFDGLLANPGLDVVALRRTSGVEAGVQLTGTVRLPRLTLVSNPPVPDNEKLAWLVTGQPPGRAGSADMAAIAAASAVLLGGNGGKPITTTIAQRLGLDDISVQQSQSGSAVPGGSQAQGQVVAFGKQITDRLTLVYEQGLTVATNALRLEYRLSRFVTVRAEAGLVSGIGIAFRRTFP